MKLDILAIGVHPDDVELGCSGTLISHIQKGYQCGIVDLTKGELGTRGSAPIRLQEATDAAQIIGVKVRENLGFEDGFFKNDKEHQLEVIKMIRKYQPDVVLTNAYYDRHPDHGRASKLTDDAVFLAGLSKVETKLNGEIQPPFRPRAVYHYIQAIELKPDFAVDISAQMELKIQSILAYKSQFYNPDAKGADTFISSPEFLDFVKGRAAHYGVPMGVKYAEAFTVNRTIGVKDVMQLL